MRRAAILVAIGLMLMACTPPDDPDRAGESQQVGSSETPSGASERPSVGLGATATPGTDAPREPDSAPGEPGTQGSGGGESPNGAATPSAAQERIRGVLQDLYDREVAARTRVVELAQGSSLDAAVVADLFAATRTPDAAQREADLIMRFGPDNVIASSQVGIDQPAVTDVTIIEFDDDCVVANATLDRLPTFNDIGDVRLAVRLVAAQTEVGWLIDEVGGEVTGGCG